MRLPYIERMRGHLIAKPWRLIAALFAVSLIGAFLAAAPHDAAAADRATLRATIGAARVDNQVTAKVLKTLPANDARLVRSQLNRLRSEAGKLSKQLSKSSGTPSKSLTRQIKTLGRRATALRAGAQADEKALATLAQVRELALSALARGLKDRLPDDFDQEQYRWSAAGTHALADVEAARKAIATMRPLASQPTAAGALAEARSGKTPSPSAGWVPIPGGCGLPPAGPDAYLPSSDALSPRLWTSPEGLAAHRQQLASPSPALASAYAKTIRLADSFIVSSGRPASLAALTKRVLTVGYAWLITGEPEYEQALASDARLLTDAVVREPVDEAKEALLLATMVDWIGPDPKANAVWTNARAVLKVRTLGSIGCSLALGETIATDKLNKSVILGSGIVTSALALSDDGLWRPGLAAAVSSGLQGAHSGLAELDIDGGSPEGPTYWNFQSVPAAGLLSSVHASLPASTVAAVPSLRQAGHFALQMAAPSLDKDTSTTRYSDSDGTTLRSTLPAWIAGRYAEPDAITVALQGQLRQGVELLWWPEDEVTASLGNAAFPGSGVAVLREGDATAWILGQPAITNHTQLDAGAVTIRVDGVDWSLDAGYGVEGPGYSEEKPGGRRWTYPQTQPAWHSTIRTATSSKDVGQVVGATAPVTLTKSTATVDLTGVLRGARKATREISLGSSQLTISDSLRGRQQPYAWSWVTQADVWISGETIELRRSGQTATLTFDALPQGSRITTSPTPTKLGEKGTRVQVEFPASSSLEITAHLRW